MAYPRLGISEISRRGDRHVGGSRKFFTGRADTHFHDFFEIELVLGGTGTQMLNGLEYPLHRGVVYLLSPADFHSVTADERLELCNLMFDERVISPEIADRFLRQGKNRCFLLDEAGLCAFESAFSLLLQESESEAVFSKDCLKRLTEYLVFLLFRYSPVDADVHEEESSFLNVALRYLQLHFRDDPDMDEAAHACGYSTTYFGKQFKSAVGMSYTDFLNTLKVNQAKRLLTLERGMSVTEIAFACGFGSLSNFYRVFGKSEGRSPLAFRAALHKK